VSLQGTFGLGSAKPITSNTSDEKRKHFQFPNGKKINGNVSEHWTIRNGKLQSLTLYFDTLTFMNNLK
jgi:hypothetical protein